MKNTASKNQPVELTATELEWLSRFLEESAEEFLDHSCSDFSLPATAENKAMMAAAFEHQGDDGYNFTVEEIMASEGEVDLYEARSIINRNTLERLRCWDGKIRKAVQAVGG